MSPLLVVLYSILDVSRSPNQPSCPPGYFQYYGSNTVCRDLSLNTSTVTTASTTISITERDIGDGNSDTSYIVSLWIHSIPCIEPQITFEYEQLDVAHSTEFISIYDTYDYRIKKCQGNGGDDQQCGVWWTCLDKISLQMNQIHSYSVYTIRILKSANSDEHCSGSYSINARLTIVCNPNATPSPNAVTRMCLLSVPLFLL